MVIPKVVGFLLATVSLACSSGDGSERTVLATEDRSLVNVGDHSETGLPLEPGEVGTFGMLFVRNTSSSSLTIEFVSPTGVNGVTVVGVTAWLMPEPLPELTLPGTARGWPPDEAAGADLASPEGLDVPPGRTVQVLVGVRAREPDGRLDSFDIGFMSGTRKFLINAPHAVGIV